MFIIVPDIVTEIFK